MYIVVEHEIADPKAVWETAQAGSADLPSNLKLHQVFPNKDGTKAVCLWEATKVDEVKDFIERGVGQVSNNTYFAVEAENAVGLPSAVKAGWAV
jgi:hypothetical protein